MLNLLFTSNIPNCLIYAAPFAVRHFEISPNGPHSVLLSWTEPSVKNGEIVKYTVTYYGTKKVRHYSMFICIKYLYKVIVIIKRGLDIPAYPYFQNKIINHGKIKLVYVGCPLDNIEVCSLDNSLLLIVLALLCGHTNNNSTLM